MSIAGIEQESQSIFLLLVKEYDEREKVTQQLKTENPAEWVRMMNNIRGKYNNMVSGHLQIKKGYCYVVLSYYDNRNKRHVKYVSTGLPEKGNKRKAEAAPARVRSEFEPPQEVGDRSRKM